jgi:hypothetical protein
MPKVLNVKEDNFESNGETVICFKVELDDRTKPVPCYNAAAGNLKVGDPLPDGWEVKVSAKGKDYLYVPKAGGGKGGGGFGASWYNSEAGVRYTQERTDRRTALMQAVVAHQHDGGAHDWDEYADDFYTWLRANQGNDLRGEGQTDATVPITKRPSDPIPASSSAASGNHGEGAGGGVAVSPGGEGAATPADNDLWAGVDVS